VIGLPEWPQKFTVTYFPTLSTMATGIFFDKFQALSTMVTGIYSDKFFKFTVIYLPALSTNGHRKLQ
jgi:hypothetical protein